MLASAQSPTGPQDRRKTAVASFLFADMCGFTAYTCLYGDELAADLAIDFQERVRELAAEEGCSVVKSLGDAVMVHSRDCRAAACVPSSAGRASPAASDACPCGP